MAQSQEQLLPTIVSRCQTIFFSQVQDGIIAQALVLRGIEQTKALELARLSFGCPGRALDLCIEENYSKYHQEEQRFWELFDQPFTVKLRSVEDLYGDKTDHIMARESLAEILSWWEIFVRDGLFLNFSAKKYIIKELERPRIYERSKLLAIAGAIVSAKKFLGLNIHPRLLVEQILLSIP